mmetsp:Transcript_135435/g.234937  ORF Transcript_135435/g.234937 Transcript_135435/m.234937 type:complete len:210 (+) Transcript_135435:1130-1759(+)
MVSSSWVAPRARRRSLFQIGEWSHHGPCQLWVPYTLRILTSFNGPLTLSSWLRRSLAAWADSSVTRMTCTEAAHGPIALGVMRSSVCPPPGPTSPVRTRAEEKRPLPEFSFSFHHRTDVLSISMQFPSQMSTCWLPPVRWTIACQWSPLCRCVYEPRNFAYAFSSSRAHSSLGSLTCPKTSLCSPSKGTRSSMVTHRHPGTGLKMSPGW